MNNYALNLFPISISIATMYHQWNQSDMKQEFNGIMIIINFSINLLVNYIPPTSLWLSYFTLTFNCSELFLHSP